MCGRLHYWCYIWWRGRTPNPPMFICHRLPYKGRTFRSLRVGNIRKVIFPMTSWCIPIRKRMPVFIRSLGRAPRRSAFSSGVTRSVNTIGSIPEFMFSLVHTISITTKTRRRQSSGIKISSISLIYRRSYWRGLMIITVSRWHIGPRDRRSPNWITFNRCQFQWLIIIF